MAQAGAMTMAHDALLPRAPGGNGPGAVLALLVHVGLVAALTVSVDWRAHTPDVVSAELWASVPQAAAPPSPAPAPTPAPTPAPKPAPAPPPTPAAPPVQVAPPPPAEPDIATQRAERRKLEAERRKALAAAEAELKQARAEVERKRLAEAKQRAEDEKKKREQAAQAAREAKAAEARLAQQREENLRRMMSQAGGTGTATSTGTAAQSAAPSAAYAGKLVALIRGNLVFTGNTPDDNAAEVEVNTLPSGAIISKRLHKSSGHKDWDDAVLRAIEKTGTLPRDVDGRVPSRLVITFRPRE